MYDTIISKGLIVDGTGTAPFVGDIAIKDGLIVEISPHIDPHCAEKIDAEGLIVTPGWIDVHTHYDGQVTWDDTLEPSSNHGVTTIVMGNCGVGFAPVRPGYEKELISLMEGVEDIPGAALHEGIPWGEWESYPQYLDYLGSRNYSLDVGSMVPHGALRAYVMGRRGIFNQPATTDDIQQMRKSLEEALCAGALGFSTSRIIGHRAMSGEPVPGTFAGEDELMGICRALRDTGRGLLQMIPSGAVGKMPGFGADQRTTKDEVRLMEKLSTEFSCPVTYTLFQLCDDPEGWREALRLTESANSRGAELRPQVSARAPGVVSGLSAYHLFQRRETYLQLKNLPWEERLAQLRKPEIKDRILHDRDIPPDDIGSMENIYQLMAARAADFYRLGNPPTYEPEPSLNVGAMAVSTGRTVEDVFYDLLIDDEGRGFFMLFFENYCYKDHSVVREMLSHPMTVSGLSDGGAHVSLICDASIPTFSLMHWVRDRHRGPKFPLEFIVAKQTGGNAELFFLHDRGKLQTGKRADINVIDLKGLNLSPPRLVNDLPGGSSRLLQDAKGYHATFVNGIKTRCQDQATGARPGRLVRSANRDGE